MTDQQAEVERLRTEISRLRSDLVLCSGENYRLRRSNNRLANALAREKSEATGLRKRLMEMTEC